MKRKTNTKLAALCVAMAATGFAAIADAATIDAAYKQSLDALVDGNLADWVGAYKDFHQHPELGLEEVRTSKILADRMRKLGYSVTEHVGKTGVVAMLKNGDGPLVMIRTDMDALPVKEITGLAYASTTTTKRNGVDVPVMHACGHDIHMAAWLGTAQALAAMKDKWHGTLMFIGQPAEEGPGGAKEMIADHVFERFGVPDHAFALHVGVAPYDSVQIIDGVFNSFAGGFDITFNGRGGHGSRPHTTIDPIMMASKFVVDVQSVVSREKDPQQFGVISVGSINAGNAGNVIPDSARVTGTVRWYDADVGRKLLEGIDRTAKSIVAQAAAPEAAISVRGGGTNVFNDAASFAQVRQAFAKLGDDGVRTFVTGPGTASEDYGEFLKTVKSSMYFRVGGFDPKLFAADGTPLDPGMPGNHSPKFAPVPEPTLRTAVKAMSTAVFNVMND